MGVARLLGRIASVAHPDARNRPSSSVPHRVPCSDFSCYVTSGVTEAKVFRSQATPVLAAQLLSKITDIAAATHPHVPHVSDA